MAKKAQMQQILQSRMLWVRQCQQLRRAYYRERARDALLGRRLVARTVKRRLGKQQGPVASATFPAAPSDLDVLFAASHQINVNLHLQDHARLLR
eukprot:6182195-Pleurochrysis_carterae.AAC.2